MPLEVSPKLFSLNRCRLTEALKAKNLNNPVVLLQGGSEISLYNTDITYPFLQDAFFTWAFGVKEPDFYGAVHVETGKAILFMPKLPPEYAVWLGYIFPPQHFKNKYQVDDVYYTEDLPTVLSEINPGVLLTLNGINSDSGLTTVEAKFEGISKFNVDNQILYPVISNLRVFKTDLELEVMKYVCELSADAHVHVMKTLKPGMMEYQLESEFLHYCYSKGGCRLAAYTPICGSGPHSSILHYGHAGAPNNRKIEDGDLCLFDLGVNYKGYCSDITTTIPANGKFSQDQRKIYEAVLKANLAVQKFCKPGVKWACLHQLATRTILTELIAIGILKGDLMDVVNAHMGYIFMPHGLGHLIGLDVHDVGGYLENTPPRPKEEWLRKLRTARTLENGMLLTVEPGCYFIDCLLDDALADSNRSQFIVQDVLNRFRGFGGVRIEDVVLITENGVVNLTKNLPRSVEEIEGLMGGR